MDCSKGDYEIRLTCCLSTDIKGADKGKGHSSQSRFKDRKITSTFGVSPEAMEVSLQWRQEKHSRDEMMHIGVLLPGRTKIKWHNVNKGVGLGCEFAYNQPANFVLKGEDEFGRCMRLVREGSAAAAAPDSDDSDSDDWEDGSKEETEQLPPSTDGP